MALQELKQRIARYFYGENGTDIPQSKAAEPSVPSAELGVPLKDLSNICPFNSSVSAPSSPAAILRDSPEDTSVQSPNASRDARNESVSSASIESPTIKRIQAQRPKRRTSFGPKAEPLAKRLWRKKERERLRELDEQIRGYTVQIAEKEANYRAACQLKHIEQCDDLTQQISELLEFKLVATREKADLRNQITRKSRSANAKYRTL